MSSFTNEIQLQALKTQEWLVLENFIFYTDNEIFTIPSWFITDWASIPWIFRFIWCPLDMKTLRASIVHDYLREQRKINSKLLNKEYRKDTDLIFLEALKISWVWLLKRYIYYIWVRIWWYFLFYNLKK